MVFVRPVAVPFNPSRRSTCYNCRNAESFPLVIAIVQVLSLPFLFRLTVDLLGGTRVGSAFAVSCVIVSVSVCACLMIGYFLRSASLYDPFLITEAIFCFLLVSLVTILIFALFVDASETAADSMEPYIADLRGPDKGVGAILGRLIVGGLLLSLYLYLFSSLHVAREKLRGLGASAMHVQFTAA